MAPIPTILLALGMSADAFAVAAAKGAALRRPQLREALKTGAIFGVIETITPIIGWLIGNAANSYVSRFDHWLSFILLAGLGIKMLLDARGTKEPARAKPRRHTLPVLVLAAISSSIDAMAVGVTLAFIDANIWVTAAAIGTATFIMATLGVLFGHQLGARIGKLAEVIGGIVLIGIGTTILLDHMGVI